MDHSGSGMYKSINDTKGYLETFFSDALDCMTDGEHEMLRNFILRKANKRVRMRQGSLFTGCGLQDDTNLVLNCYYCYFCWH